MATEFKIGDTISQPAARVFCAYRNREVDQPKRTGLIIERVWFVDFEHAPHWRLEARDPQSSYRVSGNVRYFSAT